MVHLIVARQARSAHYGARGGVGARGAGQAIRQRRRPGGRAVGADGAGNAQSVARTILPSSALVACVARDCQAVTG